MKFLIRRYPAFSATKVTGSLANTQLADNAVLDQKISSVSASKITGSLVASQITFPSVISSNKIQFYSDNSCIHQIGVDINPSQSTNFIDLYNADLQCRLVVKGITLLDGRIDAAYKDGIFYKLNDVSSDCNKYYYPSEDLVLLSSTSLTADVGDTYSLDKQTLEVYHFAGALVGFCQELLVNAPS